MRWRNMWAAGCAAALALVAAPAAEAADAQGRYNPHGVGRIKCKRLVELCSKERTNCVQVPSVWIEGYVTALNAVADDTYDFMPWQDPALVAEMALSVCRNNPDAALVDAVQELVRRALAPERLQAASEPVRIGEGDKAVRLHKENIRQLQQRLVETGHLKGGVDGDFGPGTKTALAEFQKSVGVEPSGIPDQRTMATLFYDARVARPNAKTAQQQQPQQPATPNRAAPGAAAPQGGGQPLDLSLTPRSP